MQGWLTSINDPGSLGDDKFGMELFYEDVSGSPSSTAKYNGNIAAFSWVHNGGSVEGYAFDYDELNRLEEGDYKTYSGSSWIGSNNYTTSYSYDLNGNIDYLTRRNNLGTLIDDVTYTYNGNMLEEIDDDESSTLGILDDDITGQDYYYDDNGNMNLDKNKEIEIDYNYLNLPEKIYEEGGSGDELLYIYDANGTKWLKKLTDGSTITKTMYAGSFVYEDTDDDAIDDFDLDYIMNPEGKIDKLTSSVEYHYYLKDHLGNTRVVFDGAGTVKQKNDYYPFGMTSYQYSSSNDNKYLYNGKELQEEQLGGVNLDWYDYGARMYDPALGRWHTIDPKAEDYLSYSPYNYVVNNPLIFIDPDGNGVFPSLKKFKQSGMKTVKNPNLIKSGTTTYCNKGVQQILNASGDKSLDGLTANQMGWKLRGVGEYKGNKFASEVTQEQGLEYANQGVTVVASYLSDDGTGGKPELFGGHVAVVAPEIDLKPSGDQKKDVASVYNVGKSNKVGTIGQTFGALDTKLFVINADVKTLNNSKNPLNQMMQFLQNVAGYLKQDNSEDKDENNR